MPQQYVLSIDQGTTSTRAVVYDAAGRVCGSAARELTQHYPQPGWVEHDAEEIWTSVRDVTPRALEAAHVDAKQLAAIGVTNQRETYCPVGARHGPAGRSCHRLARSPHGRLLPRTARRIEDWIQQRTGLVLDPYFSATKCAGCCTKTPRCEQGPRRANWRAAPSTAFCSGA